MANLLATVSSLAAATSSASWVRLVTTGNVSCAAGAVHHLVFSVTPFGGTDTCALYRFKVDGSITVNGKDTPVIPMFADDTTEMSGGTLSWFVSGLSAGNHEFEVEWITEGSNDQVMSGSRARVLQVIEHPDVVIKVDVNSVTSQSAPASWADMTDMTGTFTTVASALYLMSACFSCAEGSDASALLRFAVDGTREGGGSATWTDFTNGFTGTSLMWANTGLSAASHAFSLQWQISQSAPATNTNLNRVFQVVEFAADFNRAVSVVLTSAQNDPATYADMLGMTGSVTPGSADSVLYIWGCGVLSSNSDAVSAMQIADDGTIEDPEIRTFSDEANGTPGFMVFKAKTGLTGAHTMSLQWEAKNGNNAIKTTIERSFQVVDFKTAGGGAALVRVVGETAQGAEVRLAPRLLARLLGEAADLSEARVQFRARAQAMDETAEGTEATARSLGLARSLGETFEAAEGLVTAAAASVVRVVAETAQIAEDVVDSLASLIVRAAAETLQGAESLARTLGLTRARDETGQASETTETARALARPVAETAALSEETLGSRVLARLATEALQGLELRLRALVLTRAADETANATETTSRLLNFAQGARAVISLVGRLTAVVPLAAVRRAIVSLTGKKADIKLTGKIDT